MLSNGFAINQALSFMQKFLPKEKNWIAQLQQDLDQGQSFAAALKLGRIKAELVDQIIIAQQHGELVQSLNQIVSWLKVKDKQVGKLRSLLNYPILLIVLLSGFYLVMKLFIQPQLNQFGSKAYHLPGWLFFTGLGLGLLAGGAALLFYLSYRHKSALGRVEMLTKLPVAGRIVKRYYAYVLCTDLAIFLANGLNLAEILQAVHQLPQDSFIRILGAVFESKLSSGQTLTQAVASNPLLPPEMLTFLYRGSPLLLLAEEMQIYSQLLFNNLIQDLDRLIVKVQPVAFLLVAALIVLMYLQLLMPIYNMMGSI